jgi:hypothetical protein
MLRNIEMKVYLIISFKEGEKGCHVESIHAFKEDAVKRVERMQEYMLPETDLSLHIIKKSIIGLNDLRVVKNTENGKRRVNLHSFSIPL